jgi:hypothetical protein
MRTFKKLVKEIGGENYGTFIKSRSQNDAWTGSIFMDTEFGS